MTAKDCGCLDEIHTGPHWRHMDALNRTRNEAQIERAVASGNVALLHHGIEAEIARLREKLVALKQDGRYDGTAPS